MTTPANLQPTQSPSSGRRSRTTSQLPLNKQLVLNHWLLGLFGVTKFTEFTEALKEAETDSNDDKNHTRYLSSIQSLTQNQPLLDSMIDDYDKRIHEAWTKVTRKGDLDGRPMNMKYFQYVALLFTEIYLDYYFRDAVGLQEELNKVVRVHNHENSTSLPEYTVEELCKLAFWQATGSGKTHVMHVNILQYLHYARIFKRMPDKIILLTPNKMLSEQHCAHLNHAGFLNARVFGKNNIFNSTAEIPTKPQSKTIEIIDINQLGKENGDKTVAVSSFEGNNLVLVDEGHRGSSGQEWMELRRQLVTNGFSYEYSATFGQAFRANNDPKLTAEYAKCIIIDYSYHYFYEDGYGKNYSILNLNQTSGRTTTQSEMSNQYGYLVGSLLVFYQQMRYYDDQKELITEFRLSRPFMLFVGGSVTKSISNDEVSDVVDILRFLARFTSPDQRIQSIEIIKRLITDDNYLLDEDQKSIFANRFNYLQARGLSSENIYIDMLQRLFHSSGPNIITAELLRSVTGEISLHMGDSTPFAVINVGDAPALLKAITEGVTEYDIRTLDNEFNIKSIFNTINNPDSKLNMLIGSRKFTEGWSSFRVSCMGLMKIGRNEGSQIIQLFGRGVRLRGFNNTLKRSAVLNADGLLGEMIRPQYIEILETLNVFGIKANYMAEFNNIMSAEDIRTPDQRISIVVPTRTSFAKFPTVHIVALKKDTPEFSHTDPVELKLLDEKEAPRRIKIIRDYYPRIQSMYRLSTGTGFGDEQTKHKAILTDFHCDFLDFDKLYHELVAYKHRQAWHNLIITPTSIRELLNTSSNHDTEEELWYTLYAPEEMFDFKRMANVGLWQQMALDLLTAYCDAFYKNRRAAYQANFLEYQKLPAEDSAGNMLREYTVTIDKSEPALVTAVQSLVKQIQSTNVEDLKVPNYNLRAIHFDRHLYTPLFAINGTSEYTTVVPTPMNTGEYTFIEDLRKYHAKHANFFADKQLYVLRNRSRGHGIGFFDAGNFYPDFIVWVMHKDKQYITFVDPKGLVRLQPGDAKITFYRNIKDIEQELRKQSPELQITLNSCIISVSTHGSLLHWRNKNGQSMSIKNFNDMHVFFQQDQPQNNDTIGYLDKIFRVMGFRPYKKLKDDLIYDKLIKALQPLRPYAGADRMLMNNVALLADSINAIPKDICLVESLWLCAPVGDNVYFTRIDDVWFPVHINYVDTPSAIDYKKYTNIKEFQAPSEVIPIKDAHRISLVASTQGLDIMYTDEKGKTTTLHKKIAINTPDDRSQARQIILKCYSDHE